MSGNCVSYAESGMSGILTEIGYCLLIGLALINVLTFIIYGIDKYKAKRSKWRVSEATLLWLCVLGGSIGGLMGMKVWRHKTQHNKFRFGVPLILVSQIAIVLWLLYRFYWPL